MKRFPLEFAATLLLFVFIGCGNGADEKSAAKHDEADPSAEAAAKTGEKIGTGEFSDAIMVSDTDEAVELVYRFREGDVFGYSIDVVENVNLLKDTMREHNIQHMMYTYKFEVLEAFTRGGGRLRATLIHVLFDGTYSDPKGRKEKKYDSGEENSYGIEKLYAKYNAPVDTPFELTVQGNGRISDVTKIDEVIKRYLRDDYNKTEQKSREAIGRDYAQTVIKQVIQLVFQKLPEHAVHVESVWTISQPDRMGFLSMKNDAEYKFLGISESPSGRQAHVEVRTASTHTGDKKMDTGQGMATMETFEVTGAGRTVLDLERHILFERKLRTDVHVRMYVEPPDELKELTGIKNFWNVLKAFTVNTIKRIPV